MRWAGVDGSWPYNPLQSVELLGTPSAIPHAFNDSAGLVLKISPGVAVAAPYAAVFKLDYSSN
eukprot:SAG31_NODE_3373_length_4351_cov_2.070790_6_plen_63_part_00